MNLERTNGDPSLGKLTSLKTGYLVRRRFVCDEASYIEQRPYAGVPAVVFIGLYVVTHVRGPYRLLFWCCCLDL